jgi:hypothetical protein
MEELVSHGPSNLSCPNQNVILFYLARETPSSGPIWNARIQNIVIEKHKEIKMAHILLSCGN